MTISARKTLLPILVITKLAEETDADVSMVELPEGSPKMAYFVRPKKDETSLGKWLKGKSQQTGSQFNLFPVILDSDGVPWAEANVYLLSRMMERVAPVMSTYSSIADDLVAYRRFLDDSAIDWTHFPSHKHNRPTYRYSGHLRLAVAAAEIAASTAKRRMSAVISFYTWLIHEGALTPSYPPWKATDRYIELKDTLGFKLSKRVTTTDISLRVPKQNDPYTGDIDDGGKLHPLTMEQQGQLIEALIFLGNTEMTLIHLFGLLTGARIQTILTFRVRHVLVELDELPPHELRFPVGPGTDIDTKNDKQQVLHLPVWFYKMLYTYACSERAKRRRCRAEGGDTENQYLFLSVRGSPMYRSRAESQTFNDSNNLRHAKAGQGVRQFITERVIPLFRTRYDAPRFHYQFHDTRASFGMNLTDAQLGLVAKGDVTLHEAREFVKTRMCHESSATTDRYLQYRNNLKLVRSVSAAYDKHLRMLAERASESFV
jgi:integrase